MTDRQWFSTGETANELGISRDALVAALRAGAPEPQMRLAGRRVFGTEDLQRLRRWFEARGRILSRGVPGSKIKAKRPAGVAAKRVADESQH